MGLNKRILRDGSKGIIKNKKIDYLSYNITNNSFLVTIVFRTMALESYANTYSWMFFSGSFDISKSSSWSKERDSLIRVTTALILDPKGSFRSISL